MLIDELNKANIEALKAKDKDARASLSVVINKYKLMKIELGAKGVDITDADLISIINKTLKELVDEQNEFKSVGNNERVEGLERQKEAIAKYLPKMLSESQLATVIDSIVSENNFSAMKDMGAAMKILKESYPNQYDGKLASTLIRAKLS